MKTFKNYKKVLGMALLTIVAGCAVNPVNWTDPVIQDTFFKNCNPKHESGMTTICQCAFDKIKVKYPDAAKADTIPSTEIESLVKECIK